MVCTAQFLSLAETGPHRQTEQAALEYFDQPAGTQLGSALEVEAPVLTKQKTGLEGMALVGDV
jgi:hypothetical protein